MDDDDPPMPLGIAVPVVGKQLTVGVSGYHDLDPGSGDLDHGIWNLGTLTDQLGKQRKVCLTRGTDPSSDTDPDCGRCGACNWVLYYTVTKGGEVTSILTDHSFWVPRLTNEPDWPWIDMGVLSVPPAGSSATTALDAYLTEFPLKHEDIRIVDRDVDDYSFRLDDFANVEFGSVPLGVQLIWKGRYSDMLGLPKKLQEMLGFVSYEVTVRSKSGSSGDQPYTISISRTWRVLPPDWGVDHDRLETQIEGRRGHEVLVKKGGRLVDLYTPAAGTGASTPSPSLGIVGGDTRTLEMDWAWQHIQGEIHWYDIWFPPVIVRPDGQPVCEYDEDGSLEINADGMYLSILETGQENINTLTLGDLNTFMGFPHNGHVHVKVTNPTGHRGVYRFIATWNNGTYYTPKGCEIARRARRPPPLTLPVHWPDFDMHGYTGRGGGPSDPPWWKQINVFSGGSFIIVPGVPGGTLDVVISSPTDKPVIARLYDSENVLVSETSSIDQDTLQRARIAPGVTFHRRLTAKGLNPNDTYALHLVSAFEINGGEARSCRIGISQIGQG